VLWGGYYGVLLVLHRQVQQVQRKLDWAPAAVFWTPISWAATITVISLGWIFFRAGSLPQASQMWSAVLSPASYHSHFVSGSLYLLVAALAAGYAIVLTVIEELDRSSMQPKVAEVRSRPEIIAHMARWRWFWVPPLYALALLLVLIVTTSGGSNTAQLMYGVF